MGIFEIILVVIFALCVLVDSIKTRIAMKDIYRMDDEKFKRYYNMINGKNGK